MTDTPKPQRDAYRKLTQDELHAEAVKRFGDDPKRFAFRCPRCGDVATIQDFIDAGSPDSAGQHCIGRNLGVLKKDAKYAGRGCDWAAYGLFRGPWEIVLPAEGDKPERSAWSFALADPPKPTQTGVVAWTPTRERLLRSMHRGRVVRKDGDWWNTLSGRRVNAQMAELLGLWKTGTDEDNRVRAYLNDDGQAWLDTYGKNGTQQ